MKGFNVLMINIRSLYSSIDELSVKIKGYDVIAVCETWLNSSYTDEMINIPEYNVMRLDREAGNIRSASNKVKRGGGVLFYVHSKFVNYTTIIRDCSKITYNLEQLWICIDKPNVRKCIVGVLYRPPSSDVTVSLKELSSTMDYLQTLVHTEYIIMGDLNVNYNRRDTKGFKLLKDFERIYNLTQVIKGNTRITEGSKSLIDLIFTDITHMQNAGVLQISISDHQPVFITKKKDRELDESFYTSYTMYDRNAYQYDIVNHDVWTMFWQNLHKDVDLLWEYMLHAIKDVADYHAPMKRMKIRTNCPHWMEKEIIEELYFKDFLYRKAKSSDNVNDWNNFRSQNKTVKKLILNAKEEYVKGQLLENTNNPRKFWRNINEISGLGKSKKKGKIRKIIDNDREYENQEAADFLNDFYTEAGPNLARSFNNTWDKDKCDIDVSSQFEFQIVSELQVQKLVKDIKLAKSCSIDGLSTRLIKDAFEVLIPELTRLYNICIETGEIPRMWCHGSISPIPKTKSDSTVPKDWRPITQIPLPGKLLEKLIHEQVYFYFNENNILNNKQYGFRPGMSTSHAIFDVLKILYDGWDKKVYTGCIFVDFARAFETIDHNILISKLELYGFGRIPLNFFRNYISNRTQSTTVNGHTSGNSVVTYGTAQGSVLGPLIYIIYVNDILKSLNKDNSIFMYADDMLVTAQNINCEEMNKELQCKMNSVMSWCTDNKITINREKTKFMLVSSKTSTHIPILNIGNEPMKNVTHYEYLGMILDNKLNMSQQLDSMYKKANIRLGILCKIRRLITESTASRIYKTMIRPYMEYIDFIVESGTKEKIEKLDKLQDRALRRIEYCVNPVDRLEYGALRSKYNIEELEVRRKRSLLRIMYDQSKDENNIVVVTHDINLRSNSKVKLKNKFSLLTKLHASPYYRGCDLWSRLPEDIQNRNIFKTRVKTEIKCRI